MGVIMSDLFGKLKQSIDKGTKVIGAKSASLIDSTKVKSEISSLKKSKDELLLKIGTVVYESDRASFNFDLIADPISQIEAINSEIALKEGELESIKAEADEKLQDLNK